MSSAAGARKRRTPFSQAMGVLAAVTLACVGGVAFSSPGGTAPPPQIDSAVPGYSQGAVIAHQFTAATGVAISPLLGLTVLGGMRWYWTSPELRSRLPWYEQPLFWGTGIAVLVVMFFGHRLPVIRAFFKAAKLWESKLAGALAVAITAQRVAMAMPDSALRPLAVLRAPFELLLPSAHAASSKTGIDGVSVVALVLALCLCAATGVLVWLMFHAINVLVLLSPIAVVDWVLKGLRAGALAVLVLAGIVSPWAGAFVSMVLLIAAAFLAGWAWRLMFMGTVFTWDFLSMASSRDAPTGGSAIAFTEGILPDVPVRTFGRIRRTVGGLRFEYRKGFFVRRSVELRGPLHFGRGLLSPTVVQANAADQRLLVLLRLPPRYRGHTGALVALMGIEGEIEVGIQRGVQSAIQWVRAQFQTGQHQAKASR